MPTTARPLFSTGMALLSASAIVIAPIAPVPETAVAAPVHAAAPLAPPLQLTASIADILTFPVLREYIINQITDLATWGVGFAEAGVNLTQAIGLLPETLRLLTQQLVSLDLQGALTTIETALVGTVAAVGLPVLDALITVRERNLAVQLALQSAVPEAVIGFGAALFGAVDGVLRASISGGQEVVDAILTFDLGNIVTAFVDATRDFLGSFAEGGQDIVDGIVFVQQTIATALATPAPTTGIAETEELSFAQRSPAEFDDGGTFTALSTGESIDDSESADTDRIEKQDVAEDDDVDPMADESLDLGSPAEETELEEATELGEQTDPDTQGIQPTDDDDSDEEPAEADTQTPSPQDDDEAA
ncbi:hypothetical protein SAMN04489835_4993 [Mycolicibacterium rutilum]|uniref:PE-PGRS family protein n=1 Tax=Mycolicibacterium rutilum TaxID=370526 RepID=A0A1H6LML5_MYCRU|nr:hypothetical protein [Mycolicibacterium rutilum]SEH86114.1 hypothetical protein SAMN04489835_4993 [Mycolicibacterium rutilum]